MVPPCCWVTDIVADREAEAGALAGRLRREERLEQFVFDLGRNADAIIADHCRPVKQAVSADKGMILHAILQN